MTCRFKNSVSHIALNRALASTTLLATVQGKAGLPATIDNRHPAAINAKYTIDPASWAEMVASARLPTGEFNEERVIDCVAAAASTVRYKMERKGSLEAIKAAIERLLREGRLRFTITTIEFADKGDEIADAALRTVFAEMVGGMFPERGPGHLQIWAYGQRAVLREAHRRPRGQRWYDKWMRNILTCHLITIVERDFGIPPSHNRSPSERMDGKRNRKNADALSGIGIVVKALALIDVDVGDEASVQENIWFGAAREIYENIWLEPAGKIVRTNMGVDNPIS
jgi:hypothetical protein